MHRYIHIFVDVPLLNRENSDLKSSKNKFYCFRFFTNSTQDAQILFPKAKIPLAPQLTISQKAFPRFFNTPLQTSNVFLHVFT